MLEKISAQRAQEMVEQGQARLIDIREPSEYTEVFIPGSRLVPLSVIQTQHLEDSSAPEKAIIFFCRSGGRTGKNADILEQAAPGEAFQIEGGLKAWEQAHLPVERGHGPLPLFRQIQIGAGALVLIGILGSWIWHPMFWLSAFVGVGLIFAGVTGFCGLGLLLSRMPWNRH